MTSAPCLAVLPCDRMSLLWPWTIRNGSYKTHAIIYNAFKLSCNDIPYTPKKTPKWFLVYSNCKYIYRAFECIEWKKVRLKTVVGKWQTWSVSIHIIVKFSLNDRRERIKYVYNFHSMWINKWFNRKLVIRKAISRLNLNKVSLMHNIPQMQLHGL